MNKYSSKFHLSNVFVYCYTILIILIGAFFLIHNAEFLNGDDCAVASHTASGIRFSLKDYTIPETGRFYPMAFILYNILVDIGCISIESHFVLHAIIFALSIFLFVTICKKSLRIDGIGTWALFLLCAAMGTIMFSRIYQYFVTTRYSLWIDYFLLVLWLNLTFCVHTKQSVTSAFLGFFVISYFSYCLEVNFVLPLCYGLSFLLFSKGKSTNLEKTYSLLMIMTSLLYLILYYLFIYSHMGPDLYDASHGSTDNIIVNAIKMFIAQKFLWLALIVLVYKLYLIINKKSEFEWWDSLLLAGFGYFLGCCLMHLNHTVYFWTASICVAPAILHYLQQYMGDKLTALTFVILAIIMCRRIPMVITDYNNERISAKELWGVVEEKYKGNKTFYFYAPLSSDTISNNYVWRELCEPRLRALIAYKVQDKSFRFKREEQFDGSTGCWILPHENELLVPESNIKISSKGEILYSGNGVSIVDIN